MTVTESQSISAAKALYDARLESIASENRGSVLFKAAPGTGKTTLLAYRIKFLVSQQHVDPNQIVVVTYTNAAVEEIKTQLKKPTVNYLPAEIPENIRTLHSFGAGILRRNSVAAHALGVPVGFDVADEINARIILGDAVEDNRSMVGRGCAIHDKRQLSKMIQNAKANYLYWTDLPNDDFKHLYQGYQTLLFENQALDYDDLVLQAARLLESNVEARRSHRLLFPYLLVDECQDLSIAETKLVSATTDPAVGCFVVGDEYQNIRPLSAATFIDTFSGVIRAGDLGVCKRCREPILKAAQAVICNGLALVGLPEALVYAHGGEQRVFSGENVRVIDNPSVQREAARIVEIIKELHAVGGIPYDEVSVLSKETRHLQYVESELKREGIPIESNPSSMVAGDFIAYLRVILDPQSPMMLRRCLDQLQRSKAITGLCVQRIRSLSRQHSVHCWDMLIDRAAQHGLRSWRPELDAFVNLIQECQLFRGQIADVVSKVGGFLSLAPEKIQSILDFIRGRSFSSIADLITQDIREELERLFVSAVENGVALRTILRAKGMDWRVVFILGMEEGVFPEPHSIDQDRRSCYVAITRARDLLYLSICHRRIGMSDAQGPIWRPESSFVGLIPSIWKQII